MRLTKQQKDALQDEINEEMEVLDNMSIYGTMQGGYSRREQCAYIDGLKDLDVIFDTQPETDAYNAGHARREEVILFNSSESLNS